MIFIDDIPGELRTRADNHAIKAIKSLEENSTIIPADRKKYISLVGVKHGDGYYRIFGVEKAALHYVNTPKDLILRENELPSYCICQECLGTNDDYMLRNDIWTSIVADPKGFLCIKCAEQRLGKPLDRSMVNMSIPINALNLHYLPELPHEVKEFHMDIPRHPSKPPTRPDSTRHIRR